MGSYSHHINWLNIWNTPLSDIGMMSEYNRYILAKICSMFHIGSILVQYSTDMAVLPGRLTANLLLVFGILFRTLLSSILQRLVLDDRNSQ